MDALQGWHGGSGLAYTLLVLQCARQAANKEHSGKLRCRPREALSGGDA